MLKEKKLNTIKSLDMKQAIIYNQLKKCTINLGYVII